MSARPLTGFGPVLRVGALGSLILLILLIGWASAASIGSAVVASGSVVVVGKPKSVQHLDGGIVDKIFVADGDIVETGDPLLRLDDTLLRANLEIYLNRLGETAARRDRLAAERDGLSTISFDDSITARFDLPRIDEHRGGQERLFNARREARAAQSERVAEKVVQFGNQTRGVEGLIAAKRIQLDLTDRELESARKLSESGLLRETELLRLERTRADLLGQLAENEAEIARIANAVRDAELEAIQLSETDREKIVGEYRQASTEVDDLVQQIVATVKQAERVVIRAPIAGVVHEMQVATIGGVVPPGAVVMQLIPTGGATEIELSIEPNSIDQVFFGQDAVVRFPAFNQRTTPELHASVARVSPTSVVNEQTGLAFYRVALALSAEEAAKLGDERPLVPGMPVEAFISTEERSLMSWLIKPLSDNLARAFREE